MGSREALARNLAEFPTLRKVLAVVDDFDVTYYRNRKPWYELSDSTNLKTTMCPNGSWGLVRRVFLSRFDGAVEEVQISNYATLMDALMFHNLNDIEMVFVWEHDYSPGWNEKTIYMYKLHDVERRIGEILSIQHRDRERLRYTKEAKRA